jgi:hypothetical protein
MLAPQQLVSHYGGSAAAAAGCAALVLPPPAGAGAEKKLQMLRYRPRRQRAAAQGMGEVSDELQATPCCCNVHPDQGAGMQPVTH